MAENEEESRETSAFNIAHRTRSQLRIDNFVLNDNLDFPDVDKNLYHNPDSEADPEYRQFLNQCYSEEAGNETNTDDNDSEYVYNDDIFTPGWRFDLNESVLHYEETESQKPLDQAPGALCSVDDQQHGLLPVLSESSAFKSPMKAQRRRIDMFDEPEFARILNQQLRQHIQLLTQTYLLTKHTTNMRNEAEEAKTHLDSYMRLFKHKTKPSNLLPATNLINNLPTPKYIKSSIRLSWRPLPIPDPVKTILSENPDVFIYPSLKPQVAFSIIPERHLPKKPKINFTLNEDKLLAYALNEFKGESTPYAFIASLLMTAKTKTQISNHIKNIKRSPGNENNPIKLYYASGELPEIDLDGDSSLVKNIKLELEPETLTEETSDKDNSAEKEGEKIPEESKIENKSNEPDVDLSLPEENRAICEDDMMNMVLDDLMAASTTISKPTIISSSNNSENTKNFRNLKLKKSMLNLMSHNFHLSPTMEELLIQEYLKMAETNLSERNNLHLLQLLTDLMRREGKKNDVKAVVTIYNEITNFLAKINASPELTEKIVLFLDLEQAIACGCAFSYLHWMRFFKFMQHVELYHDGDEGLEKKLARLIDALQKDDSHKIRLAIAGLVNKQPFLKREFESLNLNEKPHPSLFICQEDFDDITEPVSQFDDSTMRMGIETFEHFINKLSSHDLSYASRRCPCRCHKEPTVDSQPDEHCGKCNLKFMKGRPYLVNKIKPRLAEWTVTSEMTSPMKVSEASQAQASAAGTTKWTFDEDREILEFCRSKAEQHDETVSFDMTTFEELVNNRRHSSNGTGGNLKKSAREIAERFNQLMDMYRDENSNAVQ